MDDKQYLERYNSGSERYSEEEIKNACSDIDKYTKDDLYRLAFHETVTLYHNWNWMREHLAHYEEYGVENFSFVHFDIKDFKIVNEVYGHDIADNLLRKVCNVMEECEWVYFSCRCDNDNFAMMIKADDRETIKNNLEEMFSSLSVLDEDDSYKVYFRCGVACISDVENYRVIITDMAKLAQKLGNNANTTDINFYTDAMKEEQLKSKLMKKELPKAIENDELVVYYQPKFNPKNDEVIGAEALIRWNYRHQELWSPGRFVPYLEKEGVIDVVDFFVLESVCRKLDYWKKNNIRLVTISVNMSKTAFLNQNVISRIMNLVNKYEVDPKYIEFEITETLAYDDINYMLRLMNNLRKLGFQLSLDDFGTGYSSLSMLSLMPLTTLKIDKSFVDAIDDKDNERIKLIMKDVLAMSKHLNIKNVVEGVETQKQKEIIEKWECDSIQGYFYCKPIPAENFEKMLSAE